MTQIQLTTEIKKENQRNQKNLSKDEQDHNTRYQRRHIK
jgi:hypothetical protein